MARDNKKFVIQEHSKGSEIHWDFMLESGDVLQTYRIDKAPQQIGDSPANAEKIFDHPLKFLSYEGPVNKGLGSVRIVESGSYEILHKDNSKIELDLNGKILKGKFALTHNEDDNFIPKGWQFGKSNI
ncbi:MAG: DNA polymerase ligase N-terminal domain-containing protein [Phycisphaerae bacterium]|nr:DNA polymerase ligase N-terminal domain-containing protein [Phycisphaerae bacterium]